MPRRTLPPGDPAAATRTRPSGDGGRVVYQPRPPGGMYAGPTGRRITGKWVGFGAEMDVNTGPWELVFQDASTAKATLDAYNRRP